MSLLGLRRVGSGPTPRVAARFYPDQGLGPRVPSPFWQEPTKSSLSTCPATGENADVAATLEETADLLASALPEEPFILGGYSFGARVALHVALRHPDRLRHLVLLSTTAGMRDEGERAARRARDEILAERIESIGTDAFLDEWLGQSMFEALPKDERERARAARAPPASPGRCGSPAPARRSTSASAFARSPYRRSSLPGRTTRSSSHEAERPRCRDPAGDARDRQRCRPRRAPRAARRRRRAACEPLAPVGVGRE